VIAESYVVLGYDPADEIVKLTRESYIGIVAVGSRGPTAVHCAKSVSSTVVREAVCPALVVPSDERS
jgi:nucleotide-binding universal stress UspA family protein